MLWTICYYLILSYCILSLSFIIDCGHETVLSDHVFLYVGSQEMVIDLRL